jgi:hypothetical protein
MSDELSWRPDDDLINASETKSASDLSNLHPMIVRLALESTETTEASHG